ncbi:ABC transporter ATP-binding protein [Limibaculum sp. M0105]|uniref:ABC transporter ATP-binding protein n=1 Tax=Thermohalobaculum xanthum TaxID=2753746 RepID=A0A8J7M8P6_9RHOB|nr:ABC transporter ATP-binding protein [Thermohalobaculum xanthum]MBK0399753.1 ABC transporter ATP-binding protein [Thermohalobaculum xanthum]
MSDTIIRAEGLGKAYRISHEVAPSHDRFSEMITDRARRLFGASKNTDPTVEKFWALRGVSFDIREGEVVGIIGRNGAGKSTLLKILSRITEPTEGRAEIRGRVASLLEVGTGFHPELTGRENIFLNGAILGMSRTEIRRKFDDIVSFADVEKFLDTPVKRYSSGMHARLAFAVASFVEPEILIVDEVLAVGDAEFQKRCLGRMSDIADSGRTVIFVSHNLNTVSQLCTNGILIQNGQIVAKDNINNCIKAYISSGERPGGGDVYEPHAVHLQTKSRIVFAEVSSKEELSRNHFPIGASITFKIKVRVGRGEGSLRLGIAITSRDGLRITTLFSNNDENTLGYFAQGDELAFTCGIGGASLAAGQYYIKLSLDEVTQKMPIDVIENALSFSVSTPSIEPFPKIQGAGLLHFQQNWRVTKIK